MNSILDLLKKTIILLAALFALPDLSISQVAINEVMASNSTTIPDEDGDFEDWIELFNYSGEAVHLLGFGLSDDYDRPYRWVFPNITIESGEYLLIWASGKDRTDPETPLHTNFAISSAGEEITLYAPDGTLMDEMEPTPIPTDISYGRYPNGTGAFYFFENPTPGAPNTDSGSGGQLEPPVFSVHPGFYNQPVNLEITHPDPNVQVFYTLDGSEPDENALLYEGPIGLEEKSGWDNAHSMIRTNPIESDDYWFGWKEPVGLVEKGHTIRAAAFKQGHISSTPNTGSWFVGVDVPHLPVLSIVTNLDNFFDNESGIYIPGAIYDEFGYGTNRWGYPNANYHQRGDEWERPISLEWFENGSRLFAQDLGVRIHGGGTRALPMKSLRLYARNSYGNSQIEHQVFPEEDYNAFKRLILRNSGQDFYNNAVMFRDAFIQRLLSPLKMDTQAYRPVVFFLNGEFWGLHNIRERYDKHFIERKYGVPEEYLDLLTDYAVVKEGSAGHYLQMLSFVENNPLSEDGNYEGLNQWMDIENYTDYVIGNVFVRNNDWPGNNIDYWRFSGTPDASVPEKDGRWRWLLFDTDFGFGLNEGHGSWEMDMLAHITDPDSDSYPNPQWSTFLIRNLFENQGYVDYFIRRFSDLMNTRFRTDKMISMINEMADNIAPVMPRHIDRWGCPASLSQWETNVELMRTFAELRPDFQWQHLQDHFELGPLMELELSVDGNAVRNLNLNTLSLDGHSEIVQHLNGGGTLDARYFENTTISISIETWPGFQLDHWIVDGEIIEGAEIGFVMETNHQVLAVITEIEGYYDDALPAPFKLTEEEVYNFTHWSDAEPAETYPDNMKFVYMDAFDPGLEANIEGFTTGAYNLTSRTRINGLGADGFSFINTSNTDGNPGYPGGRLGGAIVGLDTREMDEVLVLWTGGTILPNSREYHIRLQYRIGNEGDFEDVLFQDGTPVDYKRNEQAGHYKEFGPVTLPADVARKPYVQLLWRYYHTGVRHDDDSGQRSMMRIADIGIFGSVQSELPPGTELPKVAELLQNYPNPFNPMTTIGFRLQEPMPVRIAVYDIMGRLVQTLADSFYQAGTHQLQFDGSTLSSGLYIYTLETEAGRETRKMMLVK